MNTQTDHDKNRTATVVVGSRNPVKIGAAQFGFERMFADTSIQVKGVSADSGVPDQPFSDRETLDGAEARALATMNQFPEADFWVGIEGGIEDDGESMSAFAWVVIRSKDLIGRSRSASFMLPGRVAELVRSGVELGHANDEVFGLSNSKHAMGAVGILTNGLVSRQQLYEQPVILALSPFCFDSPTP